MQQNISRLPPLSLYFHIPWCIKKCPYCDFNSHVSPDNIPEQAYIDALLSDLAASLEWVQNRPLKSIFFGGGTPSLLSAKGIDRLLRSTAQAIRLESGCEITLEANPGTFEQRKFKDFRYAGINRLSIGVQSFDDPRLGALGRIHSGQDARNAIITARKSGFDNINIDLMHGLPGQQAGSALEDIWSATEYAPEHISWYQLTIERNTAFYKSPPELPDEEQLWSIYRQGQELLTEKGYQQYEVSAYARDSHRAEHNINYWEFGDYLGIGAGAHGKITLPGHQGIVRSQKTRKPADYINGDANQPASGVIIKHHELITEFMMNALRLSSGFTVELFEQRTGLDFALLQEPIENAVAKGLLHSGKRIRATEKGWLFLDDLVSCFL